MFTISSPPQSSLTGSAIGTCPTSDCKTPSASSPLSSSRFDAFQGATALTAGNPGFGARGSSRFGLAEFLG